MSTFLICGWCGKPGPLEDMRKAEALTGNDWPIHSKCYMDWYQDEPRPSPEATEQRAEGEK